MPNRIKELKELIAYHEKNIVHIQELAQKEEVPEYRADMYSRVDRTHSLLGEWRRELAELERRVPDVRRQHKRKSRIRKVSRPNKRP